MKKTYFLIVLFLCGLSVGNLFASASAAAAEEAAAPVAGHLGAELRAAAGRGNENEVKELIAAGADVNARNYLGDTALILATTYGHENIVDLLLEKGGIEVNAQDVIGWTALMRAAGRGDVGIVQKLLDAGADKDIQGMDNQTAETLARNDVIANMIRDYRPSGGLTKSALKR